MQHKVLFEKLDNMQRSWAFVAPEILIGAEKTVKVSVLKKRWMFSHKYVYHLYMHIHQHYNKCHDRLLGGKAIL